MLNTVLKMVQRYRELLETARLAVSIGMPPDWVFNSRGPYAYLTVLPREECLRQIDELLQK
ncbi:hypothetical protein AMJ50_01960 [Parcubacteria bacterium DG_74_3]|nr:MAG: hypothetical protein AMJ50_01960 [Parcubacteria bacterium DG_74_3]